MFEIRDEDCEVWRQHGSDPGWRARHKPTGITITSGHSWQEDRPPGILAGLKEVVARERMNMHRSNESRRYLDAARIVANAIASLGWPAPPKTRKPKYRLLPEGTRPCPDCWGDGGDWIDDSAGRMKCVPCSTCGGEKWLYPDVTAASSSLAKTNGATANE